MAFTAMLATFVMALLAKKALLISLATFGLVIYDKLKKKTHILHYHVKPSHKNYLTDKDYVRGEPHKYAVYSDEYHSAHRHKHNSGHNPYGDTSDFILQNILADTSKWYQKDAMGM
ncbi:hypothetical protein Cfor_04279 [Coptotermes formosanus]|uniref:Uncharacterized protein n=1 Tax=Coptotermes formosanus TaxID=36987 RepID=A0A6L2PY00_COPFO|nr:hypothetical protein Cfor_04279 [Coptotermes formosanus]